MSAIATLQRFVKDPKVIALIAIVAIISIAYAVEKPNLSGDPAREVIEKKLDRSDFTTKELLRYEAKWALVEIISTDPGSKGNNAFVILKHDDGETILKLGPGTYFDTYSLNSAGVPKGFQGEIEAYFNEKRK